MIKHHSNNEQTLDYTKTKGSQSNSELQALINELKNFFKVVIACLHVYRFEEYIALQLMFDNKIETQIYK